MTMDSTNSTTMKIPYLREVADADVSALHRARDNYGESWCKRGGVGAFMMLARKWDRLEQFLSNVKSVAYERYDILDAIRHDVRPEGVIDDIRDLRRYLMLVEAKAAELGYQAAKSKLAKDSHPLKAYSDLDENVDVKTTVTPAQLNNAVDYVRKLEGEVQKLKVDNAALTMESHRLKQFKLYTHDRMDKIGVPANPEPVATLQNGCRIGARFDWLIAHAPVLNWDIARKAAIAERESQPRASELHPK